MNKIYKILFVIILACVFSGILFHNYSKTTKITFSTQRVYKDSLIKLQLLNLSFSPGRVLAFDNGYVVRDEKYHQFNVTDLGGKPNKVISFNTNTSSSRLFVSDYRLKDSTITIAEAVKHEIIVKSFNDKLIAKFSSKVLFNRCILISDSTAIAQRTIKLGNVSKIDFVKFNYVSNSIQELPALNAVFNREKNSNIFYEGFFTKSENGNIFYVCYLTNNIICFNEKGKIIFNKHAIYNVIRPNVVSENGYLMAGESVITTSSIAADNSRLIILSNIGDKRFPKKKIMDVYDARNGTYLNSYKTDFYEGNYAREISIENNSYILSYPKTLIIYKNDIF